MQDSEVNRTDPEVAFDPTVLLTEHVAQLQRANEALRRELEVHRRVESVLLAGQVRFEAFLESADGILVVDERGRIVLVNNRIEELFGYSRDELLGKPIEVLLPEHDRETHVGYRAEYATSPRHRPMGRGFDLWAQRKDGSEFPVEVSLTYVPTEDGAQVMAFVVDITLRRMAEEALERSYRNQRLLKDLLQVALIDAPLEELLERALDIILSMPWLPAETRGGIFVVEDEPEVLVLKAQRNLDDFLLEQCARVRFGQCLCGRAAATGEMQFASDADHDPEHCGGGMAPHQHYSAPILFQDQTIGVIMLYLDVDHRYDEREAEFLQVVANTLAGIIERKRAEDALRHYAGELEARNLELDAYGHTVAHDLKAPLSMVMGYVYLMLDQDDSAPLGESRQFLDEIQAAAQRMIAMIDQLLWLATVRNATEAAAPVTIGPVIEAALARFKDRITKRGVAIEIVPELPSALGLAPWLEEVFANLIDNAIKYMGPDNPAPRIVIDGAIEGGMARYTVQDNGIGIAIEDQDRLFEMFTRFSAGDVSGAGLGLSIVHRVITRLDGQVGVESAPGEGSTFWFALPAAE